MNERMIANEPFWVFIAYLSFAIAAVKIIDLLRSAWRKIPMMCAWCGYTLTDEDDPSARCPRCDSHDGTFYLRLDRSSRFLLY